MHETPLRTAGVRLLGLGAVIAAVGVVLLAVGALGPGGRLPGDIVVRGGRWTLVLPLATSLVLSILATLLLNALLRR
jgi:hypothetical protein